MNIIIKPYGSDICCCRPDTTWERENRDFYSPECVNEILWTPVVFARISKAGKCIGAKFVDRYYDGVGCGMLMHCNTAEGVSSCADHSSILPMPLYNPIVMEEGKGFTLMKNEECLAVISAEHDGWKTILEETICLSSRLTSLRIGDFVAVELTSPQTLAVRKDGESGIKGTFCENEIFDFKIIF